MRRGKQTWRVGLVCAGLVVTLAALGFVAVPSLSLFRRPARPENLATSPVRRTDLRVSMTAGGRVDSSERTIIECEIENVEFRVRGAGMMTGGSSVILSVVPEGTMVKKGDVICVLDASTYEELVRQQQMNVDRARADYRQAELAHQVAQMAITEYKDGLMRQALKDLNGQITLIRSDVERATDRLAWSKRMLGKGYIPASQVSNEEFALARLQFNLKKGLTSLDLFQKFSAPKYLHILRSDVLAAEAVLNYQSRRLQRVEERLDYYKRQVERCTIKAPHDGFLIYASDDMKQIRIEAGMTVRQRQKLFYLPDLAHMEVAAMLHESVVRDVRPGMRARVKVEGLPDRYIEGHVESVTQLPTQNFFNDVKYFVGTVKLQNIPRGLMPGMSAEVEIATLQRPDVLVIPAEALTVEQGQDVCYVARDNAIERREVRIGQATRDLLEVVDGLDEGESVVLEPHGTELAAVAVDTSRHAPQAEASASASPAEETSIGE